MARRIRQFSPPAFEPKLSRIARKSLGIYYTPPEIVQRIVELTIAPLLSESKNKLQPLRILDPSCGAGEFLAAAFERLRESLGSDTARSGVWGIDIDAAAIQIAQTRLAALDPAVSVRQIITGDALTTRSLASGSFDAIVGNPPYVNIRQLAKTLPGERIASLRDAFTTARGNFDLYVLFIERAIELLRPGGRCGLIIPSKWATLEYARECRKLLLSKTTIEHVIDLSDSRVFTAASVYPHVLIFKKAIAKPSHLVKVNSSRDHDSFAIRQASLSAEAIQLSPPLDVESRVRTAPLGSLAQITCGTAGYAAQKIARRIIEAEESDAKISASAADFITSGNIDRYQIELGEVRYLNRRYVRPKLPLAIPELTPAKRKLFQSSKIVVAGMSRRLEAAWDTDGLALGVQVYAATDFQLDPFYLLALLNSKLLSYVFATRFAAKRLGGGYLAINKGQLAQLPIHVFSPQNRTEVRQSNRLSQLAQTWSPAHEPIIDQLVYQLYRLTDTEIARIERHFAELAARAA